MKKINIPQIVKENKDKAELASLGLSILFLGGLRFHQTHKITIAITRR